MDVKVRSKIKDDLAKMVEKIKRVSELDEKGREIPDPTPLFLDVGERTESLAEQIKRVLKIEMNRFVSDRGGETFEEANDFNVPDEETEIITEHEFVAMEDEYPIGNTFEEIEEVKKNDDDSNSVQSNPNSVPGSLEEINKDGD